MKTLYVSLLAGPLLLLSLIAVPLQVRAQYFGNIDTFGSNITGFFANILVPLVFAVALVVFLWGVYKYLILGGGDEKSREQGKGLMLWAVIGFVIMVSIWAIVNFLAGGLIAGMGGTNASTAKLKYQPSVPMP